MFARRVGSVLQAFSCVPRVAPIIEMDSCFAEIPVWVDGSVQFIDVEALVLKVHGVQKPCNDFLSLTIQAVESWVEINRCVIAVKSPPMVKHREGEISKAPISKLYLSRTLKQWENSLQYPYFRKVSRSRLELGKCLQAGCLQGGEEEYSLNNLLREAEDGLVEAVNPFIELKSAWAKYTAVVSLFLSVQYEIILIMLLAVFIKYGASEHSYVLLSAVFEDLYGVVNRKCIRRIYEPRSIEMEPMMKNTSNIHNGVSAPQCSELKWEYNSSEIDWYWGYL